MTEKEINVAIAEACGAKWHKPTETELASGSYYQYEPDYCHDLNTMHEAVLSMDENNRAMWFNNLCDIVNRDRDLGLDAMSLFSLINATAHQRAEAFLRTIGKWKE